MSESQDQVLVSASKHNCQPETWIEYEQRSTRFLSELRRIHPIFLRLAILKGGRVLPVPNELEGLPALIADQALDSDHCDRYLNLGSLNKLAPESMCRIGFAVSYYSFEGNEDPYLLLPRERGGVELTLQGCSASSEPAGQAILKLPTHEQSDLRSEHVVKQILRLMFEVWGCTQGRVRSLAFERKVNEGKIASYSGQWFLYLPWTDLQTCVPSDIHIEPFHQGVLVASTLHPPDVHSEDDVTSGRRLGGVLDELGLSTYADYVLQGWPRDEEEWRYEEFVSGAPPGRKYRVHCVDFDGFDADRNVLLFAKLFRRLKKHPKQWGLRGWDGPVLNEAKRQVNAARKAGGVPIEWHIGLQEPAERVRELLADYTDISEKQLKVIYTTNGTGTNGTGSKPLSCQ